MKKLLVLLFFLFPSQVFSAAGMTIQSLPSEPEEPNPVCRNASGTLANCTPTAGVASKHLMPNITDYNGVTLGTLVAASNIEVPEDPQHAYRYHRKLDVLSNTGYLFTVDQLIGTIYSLRLSIYFTSKDCTGTPHISFLGGRVFGLSWVNDGGVFYLPKTVKPFPPPTTIYSSSDEDEFGIEVCTQHTSPLALSVYPALPNDPAITGVTYPDKGYEGQLRIELP